MFLAGASIGIIGAFLLHRRTDPAPGRVYDRVYTMASGRRRPPPAPRRRGEAFGGLGTGAFGARAAAGGSSLPFSAAVEIARDTSPIARPSVSSACGATWAGPWQVTLYMGLQSSLAYIAPALAAVDPDRPRHDYQVEAGLVLSARLR
ncbi:hypothetical protein [Pseudomonas aeruginosa]|uniref:hypothetical protein n=1 Tax=Pseudomonas aeruginosa TaxID=287 RepID=UPI003D9C4E17